MKVGTDAMLLGALVDVDGKKNGLDIGTGTGVLGLMMAQRNPHLFVVGVEVDTQSAEECALNFCASEWSERLAVYNTDFAKYASDKQYDLIISNPPFYESTLVNRDERKADARHAQSLPMSVLVAQMDKCLSIDGNFWLIIPTEYEVRWVEECKLHALNLNSRISIIGKVGSTAKRTILNFSRKEMEVHSDELTVREKNGDYTSAYKKLTLEFHYKPV